ncbi:MAG: hypothetical protein II259_11070, partial [Selenomonadaceae bacterium]|nr:hypothetical protein [Selenomonadaceae bacterium]
MRQFWRRRRSWQPADFNGVTPKVVVKPEDTVKAGDALFVDKNCPELRFVSPVS